MQLVLGSGFIPTLCASLVMAPGAGYLLRKLESLRDGGAASIQVLAAQADMLAELTLEEIKGVDCDFDIPNLAIIWGEINFLKRVATAIRKNHPIPHVEVPLEATCSVPPCLTGCQKDFNRQLEKQVCNAWSQEPFGLRKCRLYKHLDTLSEHLMSLGQLLDWDQAGVWGIVLQRGLGVICRGQSVPEFKRIVD